MTLVPTYTLAGGEISPALYGRVDLQKYQTGVKRAKNVLVGVEGGLFKRPGQYFIGKPKFQDKISKFVPWRIANDDSYVLEFGDEYIRFIRLGGYVEYPPGHTPDPDSDAIDVDGFLEVPTPYTEDQVRDLKFTFANDIVYIFHKEHETAQLRRLGLYDWDLVDINFDPRIAGPTGVTAEWQWWDTSPIGWVEVTGANPIDGYAEIQKPFEYQVTALMPNGLETKASTVVTEMGDLGHHRLSMLIEWDAVTGAEEYIIYKGENGVRGFIGRVIAPITEFRDTNFAPSYDRVPPGEFEGFNEDDPTEFPAVGQFYKQRLGYANIASDEQRLWFSRPLFFNALDSSTPVQDDDALNLKLVGNERHSILHMVQMRKFLIFTDTAEWILHTTNDEALSIETADPRIETSYGCDPNLAPMTVGDRILFVQNMTRVLLDLGYDFTTNAYKADDLTRLARHLFEDKNIISWSYSMHPHSVIWTVCDDGSLQSMTYSRDHEIWGWSWQETEGEYLDCASVPEFDQFASYYQVRRRIGSELVIFTERAEIITSKRVEDQFFVDCGLTYNPELPYTVGSWINAREFTFTKASHGLSMSDEVLVENKAWRVRCIVIGISGNDVTVEPKYDDDTFADEDGNPFESLDTTDGFFYECVDTISGFDHLAGKSNLVALADGNVIKNVSVDPFGQVVLPFKAGRVHVGFPYEAEIITLNMDPDQLAGKFLLKSVNSIKLHLSNSRGVLAGPSESNYEPTPLKPRSDEDLDHPNRLLNGLYEIEAPSEWSETLGVRILMPYPLPATILNIVPDLDYEG